MRCGVAALPVYTIYTMYVYSSQSTDICRYGWTEIDCKHDDDMIIYWNVDAYAIENKDKLIDALDDDWVSV